MPAVDAPRLEHILTKIIFILSLIIVFPCIANAWNAMDSITGKKIEILWPLKPSQVAKNGNHEIQYRFKDDSRIRIGEVTGWLHKCHGKFCPSDQTRTFELNTFSDHGLMYLFPLPE